MALKKKPSTAVAAPKPTAVSTARKPMGRGFEEADADSFAIPFLSVLQKLSPQVDKSDPLYIKGAEAGMFLNTATNELFEEVELIPVVYQRRFNRWAPRATGGGFKGVFMPAVIPQLEQSGQLAQSEDGRWYFALPDGSVDDKKCDILTDTRLHFCLMVGEGGALSPVLVTLSRTQLKKSKKWMTAMKDRGGDMFSTVYTARSLDEENDKGKWKGWTFNIERDATPAELAAAEELFESVSAGKVKVKMDDQQPEE